MGIATVPLSVFYIFGVPHYLGNRGTYSVLVVVLALAAVASGQIARRISGRKMGWLSAAAISAVVTLATLLTALFVIVNSSGSQRVSSPTDYE